MRYCGFGVNLTGEIVIIQFNQSFILNNQINKIDQVKLADPRTDFGLVFLSNHLIKPLFHKCSQILHCSCRHRHPIYQQHGRVDHNQGTHSTHCSLVVVLINL